MLDQPLTHIELFAGIGACALAAQWFGFEHLQFVEIDPFCQKVLQKNFPGVPIHDDIKTFNGEPFRGRTDLVCGGFPCQDISSSGTGAGLDGMRSSLFFEMLRVVRESRPVFVLAENSDRLRTRGIDRVTDALVELGYTVEPFVVGAGNAGLPHERARCFVVAHLRGIDVPIRDDRLKGRITANIFGIMEESQEEWAPQFDLPSGPFAEGMASDSAVSRRSERYMLSGGSRTKLAGTWPAPRLDFSRHGGYQPPIPGVDARSPAGLDPNRRKRIKALGNCNPPQVYAAFLKPISDALRGLA